ncbi:zinc-dependent alcohol dehydrogenase family protein [Jiangella anatolica]|uniref:Alcohol dehydrogenase n=1 Tax=Jiangella anatolica TaxID=2670374 RepID=A0A2W2C8E8_9ACTN|nr:zinc-dependent alcohol dehydrogenase family protein [Jiangella anatolica]PZF84429.1 alcohol dehydrogenase [Jiangella anatolica]
MRAMVYEGFQERPVVRDVPEPACPPGGAVIRVEATGLCRSDWHGWMGHDDDIRLPHVPGHEFAGVLAQVAPDVEGWRPGERVTVPFVCACGECEQCRAGDHQVCARQTQPGFTHWGSFAEYVAIEHAAVNLVRLPGSVDTATAAGLGCRFATAYRAVVQQGRVAPGEWVTVHGCGGLGLSAVMIAAAHGANVIAIDVATPALELATRVGATLTIDASDGTDVVAAVHDATAGGAHLSLDALGSTATFQNSVRGLRTRGRHVQAGLLLAGHATQEVAMPPVVARELDLLGSHGMSAHHYPAMLAEIATGQLRPDQLLGAELTLEEGVDALLAMSKGSPTGVTILRPNGPVAGT